MLEWNELEKTAQDNGLAIRRELPCGLLLSNADHDPARAMETSGSHGESLFLLAPSRFTGGMGSYTLADAIALRDALIALLPVDKYDYEEPPK